MQPDKKQLEILLMEYFRRVYPEFPKGTPVPSESPDFILQKKNHRQIGIELTRLNPGNSNLSDENCQSEIRQREQFINRVQAVFGQNNGLPLFTKFRFSEKTEITPENELELAVKTAQVIRKSVEAQKKGTFFRIFPDKSKLPDVLENLLIVHHPALKTPVWERANNLGESADLIGDIRKAIHKKDEKLRLYHKQHLNYYWLLITTDILRQTNPVNIHNLISGQTFTSEFKNVFILELIPGNVIELI